MGEYIHSCGFYNGKARDIVACARKLIEKHGGKVPGTMEELTALPGVGRKTANLILGDVFGQAAYVCDTHCIRITGRLGITDGSKDPLQVERQLRQVHPAQGVQQLLPPDGALRPGHLHRPLPQVRGLPPGKGLRHGQGRQKEILIYHLAHKRGAFCACACAGTFFASALIY